MGKSAKSPCGVPSSLKQDTEHNALFNSKHSHRVCFTQNTREQTERGRIHPGGQSLSGCFSFKFARFVREFVKKITFVGRNGSSLSLYHDTAQELSFSGLNVILTD